MDCTIKLTLDKVYEFNSQEELNKALEGIDVNEVIKNPSKYRVENGRIVENNVNSKLTSILSNSVIEHQPDKSLRTINISQQEGLEINKEYSSHELLQLITKYDLTPLEKGIVKRFMSYKSIPVTIHNTLQNKQSGMSINGGATLNGISLNNMQTEIQFKSVLIHELTHIYTRQSISNPTTEQIPNVEELYKIFNYFKMFDKGQYGFTSIEEFIAEMYSNEEFRNQLDSIKVSKAEVDNIKTNTSLLQWLKNTLSMLLGIEKTMLDYALVISKRLELDNIPASPNHLETIDSLYNTDKFDLNYYDNTGLNYKTGYKVPFDILVKYRDSGVLEHSFTQQSQTTNNPNTTEVVKGRFNVDSNTVLQEIADSNFPLNGLAKKLLDNSTTSFNIDFIDRYVEGNFKNSLGEASSILGDYNNLTGNIRIFLPKHNHKLTTVQATILHEVIHGLTLDKIQQWREDKITGKTTNKEDHKIIEKLEVIYNKAKEAFPDSYYTTNLDEFITGSLTNSLFMNQLKELPPVINIQTKSMWVEVFDNILKLFKITKGTTLYEQAFNLSAELIETKSQYDKSFGTYTDADVPFERIAYNIAEPVNNEAITATKAQLSKFDNYEFKNKKGYYNKKEVKGVTPFIDELLVGFNKEGNQEYGIPFNLDEFKANRLNQITEDSNNKPEITNPTEQANYIKAETAKLDEQIKSFKTSSDIGSNLHKLHEEIFKMGYSNNFDNDKALLVDKYKGYFGDSLLAAQYVEQVFTLKKQITDKSKANPKNNGVMPVFITEKRIVSEMLPQNTDAAKQLGGIVDLIVINGDGSIDIYDWKTANKELANWDTNKDKHIHLQMELYKAILRKEGFKANESFIVPIALTNKDKIEAFTMGTAVKSSNSIGNPTAFENLVKQYFDVKSVVRVSKPVTNQIKDFLKKAFNYEKQVVDEEVTVDDIIKFKAKYKIDEQELEKLKDPKKKVTFKNNIERGVNVEYTGEAQIKTHLMDLRKYNANVRDRMVAFYNDLKAKKGGQVFYKGSVYNENKSVELTNVFSKFLDWDIIEPDEVMIELDIIGFRNPRTNQIQYITVNSEASEKQLELNFSRTDNTTIKGKIKGKLNLAENTIVSNFRSSINDNRLLKATTGNLHLIKAYLFTELADKVDGQMDSIIVLSEKSAPQLVDMNTLNKSVIELTKLNDFQLNIKSKDYKVDKVEVLKDFYNQILVNDIGNVKKSKYEAMLTDLSAAGKLESLIKRQKEIMLYVDSKQLQTDAEFLLINDAILFLNGFSMTTEEDITKWGYYITSGNKSSSETDAPNNIKNKIVQKVKELIDKAISLVRYDYEDYNAKFEEITKRYIDSKQSTLRQTFIGDTDSVYNDVIEDKQTMMLKDPKTLTGIDKEFVEYYMKVIDNIRKKTMGINYDKLTPEQKREIPLIKAYTEQSKGSVKERMKSQWEDMFNVDSLLSSDNIEKSNKRVEIANRFAYQEANREDVLLSGEHFETNLAYVLNTYVLSDIQRKRFNEVLPVLNALKVVAQTSETNLFNDLTNVTDNITSLIDNIVFKQEEYGEQEDKNVKKAVSAVTSFVSNLAIGLSPMTGFIQFTIGLFNGSTFAASNKMVGGKSYAKAVIFTASPTIDNIVKNQKLNAMYGVISKDLDILAKQNSFIDTGLRAFMSRWLHWFNYAPDFFNRMCFVNAKMIEDGSFDAHSMQNDLLIYDETKDKRWFDNGVYNPKNEKLLFIKQMMKEEDGLDSNGNLKRAYTFKEIRAIKEYANQVFGSYSKEDKIKFGNSIFGRMFLQFKTWMRARFDQYWKTYRVNEVVGNWQLQYEYNEDGSIKMENGNPVVVRNADGVAQHIWVGNPEEGYLNTLLYMFCEAKTLNPLKLETWRQNNLKQGTIDLSIIALLSIISAAIDDDDKEKDRIEYLFFKLQKDMFIVNTVGSIYNGKMPIASVSYTSEMMSNIFNIQSKGFEPLIKQTGLGRLAYSITSAD